ncbi:MAG: hypothetical protein CO167_12125 [Candidatus Marinimicrobia bacterium CG_4_9_14_3_um_filter_48_9]|nr:MAG: hypothetical protein CO167_12125 [Candidatus Marinimicrobia bacterium CG_4_9_14_3_um_filter_48_9]
MANEGYPIKMSEIIASLTAPVYVERVMMADTKSISNTRRAVRKAIKNQVEKKGFSFVEVLSTCPTGWKMTAPQAEEWIKTTLAQHFPLGVLKDISGDVEPLNLDHHLLPTDRIGKAINLPEADADQPKFVIPDTVNEEIKISGFGGQGVLSLGVWLSEFGMREGLNVSWIPSYGPEMRGGTAHCHVKLANRPIGSPLVVHPTILVATNRPSLEKFEKEVIPGGKIFWDNSLMDITPSRTDIIRYPVPATEIANQLGNTKTANVVMLGVITGVSEFLDENIVRRTLPQIFKKKHLLDINMQAFNKGLEVAASLKRIA